MFVVSFVVNKDVYITSFVALLWWR